MLCPAFRSNHEDVFITELAVEVSKVHQDDTVRRSQRLTEHVRVKGSEREDLQERRRIRNSHPLDLLSGRHLRQGATN